MISTPPFTVCLPQTFVRFSWPRMSSHFDERFRRMWQYFLSASAAAFRAKKLEVWQVLLEPQARA